MIIDQDQPEPTTAVSMALIRTFVDLVEVVENVCFVFGFKFRTFALRHLRDNFKNSSVLCYVTINNYGFRNYWSYCRAAQAPDLGVIKLDDDDTYRTIRIWQRERDI